MRAEEFMYFCIKNYIGTRVKIYRQLKCFDPFDSLCHQHRFKVVVLVLFLLCVVLWLLLRGVSCWVLPMFFSPVKHFDHLAWGRERWSICFSCICLLLRVNFCPFSLLIVEGCWMHPMIVSLPGLFFLYPVFIYDDILLLFDVLIKL